jgi:hypothetical protein
MSRGTSRIRKSEVTRLIAAVQAAGLEPQGVKVAPDGGITVLTGKVVTDDLDRELAAFEARHARAS